MGMYLIKRIACGRADSISLCATQTQSVYFVFESVFGEGTCWLALLH